MVALPLRYLLAGALLLVGGGALLAKPREAAPTRSAVLELTGQKATQVPDILFLAPRLT